MARQLYFTLMVVVTIMSCWLPCDKNKSGRATAVEGKMFWLKNGHQVVISCAQNQVKNPHCSADLGILLR